MLGDAPALKAAHIRVAMGNKGTETKSASALVITNDNLEKPVVEIFVAAVSVLWFSDL